MQIGSDQAWLWIAVEPIHRQIIGIYISRHRNMLVAESFLRTLIRIYGKHTTSEMVLLMLTRDSP
jgi:transposase-like protein